MTILVPLLVSVITAATPLLLAALGELVAERAGVLNLGVEGMMLVGAVSAFAVMTITGSSALAVLAGAGAGTAMAALFGLLTLTLASNQVATGLALTLFGLALIAAIGEMIPVVGPLLFSHDVLVYLSIGMTGAIAWFLQRTRAGLILRGVGEADGSAHSIGFDVRGIRYGAVLFGGATAGLGGAYLSLAYTPLWVEGMTAGRGWIALALVVFAGWRPWRVLAGAYLFGGVTVLQLYAQGSGLTLVPTQFLAMLPYLATVVVLTLMSLSSARRRLAAPACLGKPFRPVA